MSNWVDTHGLYNNMFAAENGQEALDALVRRECAYVVDTATMTIQWKQCNGDEIEQGLIQLDGYLNP